MFQLYVYKCKVGDKDCIYFWIKGILCGTKFLWVLIFVWFAKIYSTGTILSINITWRILVAIYLMLLFRFRFSFIKLIAARAYPGFCSMKQLEVFLLPLDGMLVHCRSLPHNLLGFPNNSPVPIYTLRWWEFTVRVKCLAQEHNTMSPARDRIRTSGVERTNHEPTLPPHKRYASM